MSARSDLYHARRAAGDCVDCASPIDREGARCKACCAYKASLRTAPREPVACVACGAVFTPLRAGTVYCSRQCLDRRKRCRRMGDRAAANMAARLRRRRRRAQDPSFRAREAQWAREYRRRRRDAS